MCIQLCCDKFHRRRSLRFLRIFWHLYLLSIITTPRPSPPANWVRKVRITSSRQSVHPISRHLFTVDYGWKGPDIWVQQHLVIQTIITSYYRKCTNQNLSHINSDQYLNILNAIQTRHTSYHAIKDCLLIKTNMPAQIKGLFFQKNNTNYKNYFQHLLGTNLHV